MMKVNAELNQPARAHDSKTMHEMRDLAMFVVAWLYRPEAGEPRDDAARFYRGRRSANGASKSTVQELE
jgi:hypothetical protein